MNQNEFVSMTEEELESASGGRRCGRINVIHTGGYGFGGGYGGYGGGGYGGYGYPPVVAGATIPGVMPYGGYGQPYGAYGAYGAYGGGMPYGGYGGYGGYGMRLGTAI